MTDRIKRMRERLITYTFPLCVDRMKVSFRVMEEMKGAHLYTIRARIHKAILEECPIAIEPDDLICGVGASKAFGIEMDYETGYWTPEEVRSLKGENYSITQEDEETLYRCMERYRIGDLGKNFNALLGELFGDIPDMWDFMRSGILLPPWSNKETASGGGRAMSGMGLSPMALFVPDYEKWLRLGCRGIIDYCKDQLKNHKYYTEHCVDQKYFWQAVIEDFEAIIHYAHRYSALARRMSVEESDPVRAAELALMSDICLRVPEFPPTNFREAIQSFWFAFLMLNPSSTVPAGRFDQYMYPYYKKDIESGVITDEEVLELLEIIKLKDMQLNRVSGKVMREKNSGMAKWHNWTLGGVDKEGNDVTNPLTYLELQAALEMQLPHHTITLRVHDETPLELIVKGLEVVKTGIGMPAFIGDKSYINFFLKHGLPIEDARQYACGGCVDGFIPHRTRGGATYMFIVPLVYDIFLHNGLCKWANIKMDVMIDDVCSYKTFEDYKEAFFKLLDYYIDMAVQYGNARMVVFRQVTPDFVRSALIHGGLEQGKEYLSVHQEPLDAITMLSAVGVINVADSLAVVKKLVFDEKKVSMKTLMDALEANWKGYEQLRLECLAVPKYGNNDDLPDMLAAEIYKRFADSVSKLNTICGGKAIPNAISITAHQPGGKYVGATPDGRFAGEILADASISPAQGRDKNGPLAAIKSAMKIDQDAYQATLMNMKFHPSALKSNEDLFKLASLIKTYLTNGGKHIQFNVVTRETLEDACKNPQEHRDLIVRVAGYSSYFTLLTPVIQKEVIDRTTNMAV